MKRQTQREGRRSKAEQGLGTSTVGTESHFHWENWKPLPKALHESLSYRLPGWYCTGNTAQNSERPHVGEAPSTWSSSSQLFTGREGFPFENLLQTSPVLALLPPQGLHLCHANMQPSKRKESPLHKICGATVCLMLQQNPSKAGSAEASCKNYSSGLETGETWTFGISLLVQAQLKGVAAVYHLCLTAWQSQWLSGSPLVLHTTAVTRHAASTE